jgi:hypothetical protein
LFRVWRRPRVIDSSDEEWKEELWKPTQAREAEVDAQVGTRKMLHDAFQSTEDPTNMEERKRQEVL